MRKMVLVLAVLAGAVAGVRAENPIIRDLRTADPSAHVWKDGKLWVYTSQDHSKSYDTMDGYMAFSTTDLAQWKNHGEVLHSRDLSWGVPGLMWAPTAAYRNGKYYLIYPHSADGTREMKCGVAVADSPPGPFKDLGWIKGVEGKWLDPCVFEDSDGEYYLYWGVNKPYVAKLKENMTELAEEPHLIQYGATNFFEASYMHKKDGEYYFSYNARDAGGEYSMGDSPYGPFEYKGDMLTGVIQDHHSVAEYKGRSYLFYHVQFWNGGSKTMRNTCVDPMSYNDDGSIQPVKATPKTVDAP